MSDFQSLKESCGSFAPRLKAMDSPLRLLVEKNVEAIVAAAIVGKALQRISLNFSLSFHEGFTQEQPKGPALFIGYSLEGVSLQDSLAITLKGEGDDVLAADYPLQVIAYYLALALDKKNIDLGYLALIPYAEGSVPEELLQSALAGKTVLVRSGPAAFGSFSQPLHKMLEQNTNPFIPSVSGSEEGAINFLKRASVALNDGSNLRSLSDLSEDEVKQLAELAQVDSSQRKVFLLPDELTQVKDLREFSLLLDTILLAGKPSLAFSSCISPSARSNALELLWGYKQSLINLFQWFYGLEVPFVEKENFMVLDASSHLKTHLLSPFFRQLWPSLDGNKVLLVLYDEKGVLNIAAASKNKSVNLKDLMKKFPLSSEPLFKEEYVLAGITLDPEKEKVQELLSLCETAALEEIIQ